MIKYVLGFLFDSKLNSIVCIKKNRPSFMAGWLNVPGGKVEGDEDPEEALIREFKEETGLDTSSYNWKNFGIYSGRDFEIYCFRFYAPAEVDLTSAVQSLTDEQVFVLPLSEIKDLCWPSSELVPFALRSLSSSITLRITEK